MEYILYIPILVEEGGIISTFHLFFYVFIDFCIMPILLRFKAIGIFNHHFIFYANRKKRVKIVYENIHNA